MLYLTARFSELIRIGEGDGCLYLGLVPNAAGAPKLAFQGEQEDWPITRICHSEIQHFERAKEMHKEMTDYRERMRLAHEERQRMRVMMGRYEY